MSQNPDDSPSKPRSWSIQSATTDGTDASRPMKSRPGKRSKHSWEYVVVDPAEDEAPPPNASRLQKELYSSFTTNFLGPRARRTRAAAGAGAAQSQPFHYKDGSDSSNSNTASESAFSSNRSNSAISPASSPAPPSRPAASRKRKDSVAPTADVAPPRKKSRGPDPQRPCPSNDANSMPIRQPFSHPLKSLPCSPEPPSASNSLMNGQDDAPRHVTSKPQPAARKSAVSEDGATKTPKLPKKTHTKPSPALSYNSEPPDKSNKDASPMTVDRDVPKPKKAKAGPAGAAKPQPKPASHQQQQTHAQKRDSLLEENMHAHNKQPHQRHALQQSNQQNSVTTTAKQWKKKAQSYYAHSPTRAELAEQLEEITHRGIAGGPCNYNSWTEYRAACAAEAAWQERDQQVVERMLDNPHVVSVLKRLRELDHEIEAERTATVAAAKTVGKTTAKGGAKAKASSGKKKSIAAAGIGDR